jgi:hypothetical protein
MSEAGRDESQRSILIRAFDFWPHACIAICLAGFAYIAFRALR